MNARWFFIGCFLLLAGCQSKVQNDRQLDHLAGTYADILMLKENNKDLDSIRYNQKLDEVFRQHATTKEQFKKDLDSLCSNMDQFHAFSDLALKKIQQQKH